MLWAYTDVLCGIISATGEHYIIKHYIISEHIAHQFAKKKKSLRQNCSVTGIPLLSLHSILWETLKFYVYCIILCYTQKSTTTTKNTDNKALLNIKPNSDGVIADEQSMNTHVKHKDECQNSTPNSALVQLTDKTQLLPIYLSEKPRYRMGLG